MLAAKQHQSTKPELGGSSRPPKEDKSPSSQPELNPLWHRLATRVQTKLTVGKPDDPFEQEADRVAEQVMRMADLRPIQPVSDDEAPSPIRRVCAECEDELLRQVVEDEEEEFLQTKMSGRSAGWIQAQSSTFVSTPQISRQTAARIDAVRVGGQPLSPSERAYFEPRFGQNFGNVRIHHDSPSATLARDIHARAFTVGRDVVFGAGQYAPNTVSGRHLLAHELTHVVQQGAAGEAAKSRARPTASIQRLDEDFRIRGISRSRDSSKVFFELGSASIDSSQHSKIAALAAPSSRELTLFGYASEEGPADVNNALIDRRIAAVSLALFREGHRAARHRRPRYTDGAGQIEYRDLRAVEVLPTPAPVGGVPQEPESSIDPCTGPEPAPSRFCGTTLEPCSNSHRYQANCGTSFIDAHAVAVPMVATAVGKLLSTNATVVAEANARLAELFSGASRDTVVRNVISIAVQVLNLPLQHRCHNACDSGCGRPAYNSRTGLGASGALLTLCPGFTGRSDATGNAITLIHESTHGTAGVATSDLAYRSSRLIGSMTGADALRNTDSYVLLIRLLHSPGSATIGPPAAQRDVMAGMDPATEEPLARRAVAYLESWLNYADFDTGLIYGAVNRSVPPAVAWSTSGSDGAHNLPKLHLLAPLFVLTDPGAAAPFNNANLPSQEDKHKLAAIHDRYDRMYDSVWLTKLTITKGAAADESWGAGSGTRRLLLQQSITVGPDFFTLSDSLRVRHLLRLMCHGLPDISPALVEAYVDAGDILRTRRGLGP